MSDLCLTYDERMAEIVGGLEDGWYGLDEALRMMGEAELAYGGFDAIDSATSARDARIERAELVADHAKLDATFRSGGLPGPVYIRIRQAIRGRMEALVA